MVLGSDWERKTTGEKLARISKIADVATILGGLIAIGFAPALALLAIQASVVTYAGAEIYEQSKKRKKKR